MFKQSIIAAITLLAGFSSATAQDGPSQCVCGALNVNVAHEGKPVGEMKKVDGVDLYITYPPGKKTENAILFMTDVFGLGLVQNKLLVPPVFSSNTN
jgi:hypothetical protein